MAAIPSTPNINRFDFGIGLSLDLQFATDKTLTARKGPTPTFTRASTATFVGSDGLIQSAAINEPRFDHDPITLACKGLLIEESRTNLLAHSAELGNIYWSNSNLSISSDNQISPDGSLNAETITASAGTPSIYRAVTCTASTVYTLSFYIKIGTLTPSDFKFAVRDDTNGVFIAVDITPNVTPVTTEWRRVTYTFTTPVGCVTVRPYIVRFGYISAGTFFLWGAQLEAGAFPTSYIPTTTVALTRSADVCSVTTAGWSNAGDDTMLAEYFLSTATSGAIIVEGSPAISWMSLSFSSTDRQRNIYRHGGTSTRFDATTANNSVSLININKTALTSGEQLALNGSLTQTVASDPPQADISTSLSIGSRGNGSSVFINGHIARIKYFRKRLPNAKIQALTT